MTENTLTTTPSLGLGHETSAGTGEGELPPATPQQRRGRRKVILLIFLLGLLAMLVTIAAWYMAVRKPIEAIIPPIQQNSLPAYGRSINGVNQPIGIAVAPSGDRIYVADTAGTRKVLVFDGSGTQVATLQPAASTGDAHTAVYVAIKPQTGDVYVSDRSTGAIYVYGADGAYKQEFPAKVKDGFLPLGLGFDAAGDLLASDVGGPFHRVVAFRDDGTVLRTYGTPDLLDYPNGIAVDAKGWIYVADTGHGRVVGFDADGKDFVAVAQGGAPGNTGAPRGLAIDDAGRLYIVDTTGHDVKVYTVSTDPARTRPSYVGTFGTVGRANGAFEYPFAVATDTRARIYVSDWGNDRIQMWSY